MKKTTTFLHSFLNYFTLSVFNYTTNATYQHLEIKILPKYIKYTKNKKGIIQLFYNNLVYIFNAEYIRNVLSVFHFNKIIFVTYIHMCVQVCCVYRFISVLMCLRKEGNVLFNDTLNTFYLRLYGVRHMVKDHSDSEKGNPLPPHRLLFPINSKGSFICTIPQTG